MNDSGGRELGNKTSDIHVHYLALLIKLCDFPTFSQYQYGETVPNRRSKNVQRVHEASPRHTGCEDDWQNVTVKWIDSIRKGS